MAVKKINQLFARRLIRSRNRESDFRNLLDHQSADGTVDRRPRGKEAINIRTAHSELRGDVGDRRLMIADPPKIPFRHLENSRPRLKVPSGFAKIIAAAGEHHSAAIAVGNSTSVGDVS